MIYQIQAFLVNLYLSNRPFKNLDLTAKFKNSLQPQLNSPYSFNQKSVIEMLSLIPTNLLIFDRNKQYIVSQDISNYNMQQYWFINSLEKYSPVNANFMAFRMCLAIPVIATL